jgi:hypothetical protein
MSAQKDNAVELCKFNWIIPGRVFFITWPEIVDEDVITHYIRTTLALMDESAYPLVHYISDTRRIKSLPTIGEAKEMLDSFTHPKMGWKIHWSEFNPPLRIMVQVISTINNANVRAVRDLDEAIRFLNLNDPSLPDLRDFKDELNRLAGDGYYNSKE